MCIEELTVKIQAARRVINQLRANIRQDEITVLSITELEKDLKALEREFQNRTELSFGKYKLKPRLSLVTEHSGKIKRSDFEAQSFLLED